MLNASEDPPCDDGTFFAVDDEAVEDKEGVMDREDGPEVVVVAASNENVSSLDPGRLPPFERDADDCEASVCGLDVLPVGALEFQRSAKESDAIPGFQPVCGSCRRKFRSV